MNENGYKVPSHEEIVSNFDNHCLHPHCAGCTFNNTKKPNALYECAIRFTKAVLSGDMCLTDGFHKEESKPTQLPSWCRVGAWVTDACPDENEVNGIHMIAGLSEDGSVAHVKDGDGREYFANVVGLKPIHFRPYTFEEAKALIGKVMEYQSSDGDTTICLIRDVLFNPFQPEREVMINHWEQEAFINAGATINGVPFGKPEIAKEAKKGGAE